MRTFPLRLLAGAFALALVAIQAGCYQDHLGAPPPDLVLVRELPAGAKPISLVVVTDAGYRSLLGDRRSQLWETLAGRLKGLGADGAYRVQIEPYTPMWSVWLDILSLGSLEYGGFQLSGVAYKNGPASAVQ